MDARNDIAEQASKMFGPLRLRFTLGAPFTSPEAQRAFEREFTSQQLHWDELEVHPKGTGAVWFAAPAPEFRAEAAEERADVARWLAAYPAISDLSAELGPEGGVAG